MEILNHYKNVRRLTINLNFLFEDEKKDRFIDMICQMHQMEPLKESIRVFNIEDAVISERNLESLFKSQILQNIQYLKLPRNSLGNKGLERLFRAAEQIKMGRIRKLDISSNMITGEEGAKIIADNNGFPSLESLDLRNNKIGSVGFKILVQSEKYPHLIDLKIDMNKLEDTGA
jgi:Leucine Rich repeat